MKVIRVSLSDSNRPHIEQREDYENSVFRKQYDLCFSMVDAILAANKAIKIEAGFECNNNIIVFDGERGSGKTSCILSVANMLTEEDKNTDSFFDQMDYHFLKEYRFLKLPMLEPSFFDKEHNAVTLFVSRLYKAYLNLNKCNEDKDLKLKLLNQFVIVQQSIKCIFGDFEPKDGLEYLVSLSSAIDLRIALFNLVDLFLKYNNKANYKLLILIDDIDINPEMADDMVEQIRKYLVLPNVIVLVSMKIKQLSGILNRQYAHEYDKPIEIYDRKDINNRVEKYLTKLFPRTQRVYMPTPEIILNYRLEVITDGVWVYKLPTDLLVRQVIPELIFKKTRYLFYNTEKKESYIVPRNLRDLRQLLQLLMPMPDYSNIDETIVHPENKLSFRKYFFEDWTVNNLTEEQRVAVQDLIDIERLEELNYKTIALLYKLISSLNIISNSNPEIVNVIYSLNNMLNISLGDVLSLIHVLEAASPDEENSKLFFFIKTLYSIRLYEAYDSITMSREDRRKINLPTMINKELHRQVKNDYEAIIGGTVCNVELFDFLPKESDSVRVSSKNISRESVMQFAGLCVDNFENEEGPVYIKLLELIMLSIHYDNTLWSEVQNRYRQSEQVCYRVLNVGCQYFRFDIGALIFNLSRPVDAIDRFRVFPELEGFFYYYDQLGCDGLLMKDLYAMMNENKYRIKPYKSEDEKWRSFCCFRNIEILEDFFDYIRNHLIEHIREKGSLLKLTLSVDVIVAFFELASKYEIKSYDRFDEEKKDGEDNAYRIHFKFYNVISDLFKHKKIKDEFEKIFNSRDGESTLNLQNASPLS
jgi:hypothetical protein